MNSAPQIHLGHPSWPSLSPASGSAPATKRKSKTFTGCWTCRARRVKCDEAQPVCNRCAHSRLICEGYGVRLVWKGAQRREPGSSSLFRTLIELDSSVAGTSLDDMNDMLHQCCNTTAGHDTQSFGPFSVFSVVPSTPYQTPPMDRLDPLECAGETELELPSSTEEVSSPSLNGTSPNTSQSPAPQPLEQTPSHTLSNCLVHPVIAFDTDPVFGSDTHISTNTLPVPDPLLAIIPPGPEFEDLRWIEDTMQPQHTENNRSENSMLEDEANEPIDEPETDNKSSPSSFGSSICLHHHLKELSIPRNQRELIHHWLVFMCKNMVPINTVDNPYRVLYLRFASEGLDSTTNCSSSKMAVLHGLCAAAAENLNNLRQYKNDRSNLSPTWHAYVALQNLRQSIINPKQKDYESVLAAIVMCIMRDTMTGQPRNWRVHIQAALGILREPLMSGVEAASNLHVLVEQCLCIAVFGNIEPDDDLESLVARLPGTGHYLSKQHSITKTLLNFVTLINKLSKRSVEADPVTLDRLELQIYLQAAPILRHDKSFRCDDNIITQHYYHVYYYAILIYFQRALRHKPPAQLQDLVHEGLTHLEEAEGIAVESNGCILLWPSLVIASECSQQALKTRALRWFDRKKRHGFNNVNMGSKICLEYWKWRDENAVECLSMSWQSFVAGTNYDVVPV